jgi:sugar-specific transcriptional regulator TrmB
MRRSQDEDTQTFTTLGLTKVQARIYTVLSKLGQAPIKTIAQIAQLDRSEVYRGISNLQELGLIEKVISNPNIFKSIPKHDGLVMLLERKTKEYNEIKTKTTESIRKSQENKDAKTLQEREYQFSILPQGETVQRTLLKATEKAQKSWDFIMRWEGFSERALSDVGSEHLKKVLEKGVKIRGIVSRGIVSKPKNQGKVSRIIAILKNIGSFSVRYIFAPPPAIFSIIDEREIFVNSVPTLRPEEKPSLWSNNPSFAAIVQDYFELQWRNAKRAPP